MAIIRNVYDVLFHVNRIVNQLESPPDTMSLPPHIENVAKAMAFESTSVDHQRSRQLIQCDYVDDEANKGNEEDVGSK